MKTLTVVTGIIKNPDNKILIALRPPHVPSPGIWEFPGGKVERDETLEDALRREFLEEIGVIITAQRSLLTVTHQTPEYQLILHSFEILSYSGEPIGRESQEIRWVTLDTLQHYEFPAANVEIIRCLLAKYAAL